MGRIRYWQATSAHSLPTAKRNPLPLTKHNIRTQSVSWRILDTSKEALAGAEVNLLLHGTGSSSESWLPLLQHSEATFRTLAVDLPGHANSSLISPPVRWNMNPIASPLSLLAMTRALTELIKHLQLRINLIVGHSAGAAIACSLALQTPPLATRILSINGAMQPLRGLPGLVFSPIARMGAASDWASRWFAHRLQDDKQIDRLLQNTGSNLPIEQQQLYRKLCRNPQHVTATLRMMASWDLQPLYQRLPNLSIPIIWVGCEKDRMIPPNDANELHRHVPNSTVLQLPNTGHLVHEERPDLIAPLIEGVQSKALENSKTIPSTVQECNNHV